MPELAAVLEAQIVRVDRRVEGGRDVYAAERDEVRIAAERVHVLRRALGLREFLGPVGHVKSKPQFLLLFGSNHGPVVLKVYGRIRPGEARVQQLWRRHGVRVVDVLDAGDHPTSWLLMAPLEFDPVTTSDLTSTDLLAVTSALATVMAPAHVTGATTLVNAGGPGSRFDNSLQPLDDAIVTHLGGVLVALRRHGYPVPGDWRVLVERLCTSSRPSLLHGDLGGGNVVRDATDGQIRILDACGYIGPPEFDAARWAARTGGVSASGIAMSTWLANERGLDESKAWALLGLELLMEAGVRELVKDEQNQPLNFPDAETEQLLIAANSLLRT